MLLLFCIIIKLLISDIIWWDKAEVFLGPVIVSGIGLADDTALLFNNLHQLYFLLHLTAKICSKYHVRLCSHKTNL